MLSHIILISISEEVYWTFFHHKVYTIQHSFHSHVRNIPPDHSPTLNHCSSTSYPIWCSVFRCAVELVVVWCPEDAHYPGRPGRADQRCHHPPLGLGHLAPSGGPQAALALLPGAPQCHWLPQVSHTHAQTHTGTAPTALCLHPPRFAWGTYSSWSPLWFVAAKVFFCVLEFKPSLTAPHTPLSPLHLPLNLWETIQYGWNGLNISVLMVWIHYAVIFHCLCLYSTLQCM